jgi:hypothetical protein
MRSGTQILERLPKLAVAITRNGPLAGLRAFGTGLAASLLTQSKKEICG